MECNCLACLSRFCTVIAFLSLCVCIFTPLPLTLILTLVHTPPSLYSLSFAFFLHQPISVVPCVSLWCVWPEIKYYEGGISSPHNSPNNSLLDWTPLLQSTAQKDGDTPLRDINIPQLAHGIGLTKHPENLDRFVSNRLRLVLLRLLSPIL